MKIFLQSITRHLKWWLISFWPGKYSAAPLSLRRLLFLLLEYPLFVFVQLIHWLGFLIDEVFFRSYREIPLESPVFIVGIPRSGTTFLHRTLAADPTYTSFTTWEALLAPSITERKVMIGLAALDRAVGAPFRRIITACLSKSAGDFKEIHEVGLDAAEEDYLALLPAGACFILLLAFPFSKELGALARLDRMPAAERERIIHFYKRCLQKHLYCHPDKVLLSKNAAYSSWAAALSREFQDARFLVCIREPDTALSSQLSSLTPARKLFGTDPGGGHTAQQFSGIYADAYRSLASFVESAPPNRAAVISQSRLQAAPALTIRTALDQVGLNPPPGLNELKPTSRSEHRHQLKDFPVNEEQIERCMQPAYEAMLRAN